MAGYDNSWIINALNAGGLSRAARDQREAERQRMEMQEDRYRWERQQAIAEKQADEAARAAKLKSESDKAAEQSKANQERYYAQLMEAQPQNADRIAQAARQRGLNVGTVVGPETIQQAQATDVEIVDAVTPEQAAMDLQGRASAVLGAPKPEDRAKTPRTPGYTDYELAKSDPEYAAWLREQERQRLARAQAVGGLKTLPTGSVEQISDIDTSIALLEDLEKEFDKAVPNEGLIEQTWARVASILPNTDVSIYNKQAELAAQKAGLVLEKGKLQASDFPRYKSMTTAEAGDSKRAGKAKIRNTITALKLMKSSSQSALGEAGYRVQSSSGTQGSRIAIERLNAIAAEIHAQNPAFTREQVRAAAAERYQRESGGQ